MRGGLVAETGNALSPGLKNRHVTMISGTVASASCSAKARAWLNPSP